MKSAKLSYFRKLVVLLALLLPLLAFAAGPPLSAHNPQVQAVIQLQDAMTPDLLTLPGVLGTATGHNDHGQLAVIVYVNQHDSLAPDIVRAMPPSARGTPIVVRLTDPFVALKGPPSGKKPGRSTTYTTKLTKGTITAINAATYVAYDSGTAYFEGQIVVESKRPFIKAGDSGSLLVTGDKTPVGLLFAGDQTGILAIANDINTVLGEFHVTVDGQ